MEKKFAVLALRRNIDESKGYDKLSREELKKLIDKLLEEVVDDKVSCFTISLS